MRIIKSRLLVDQMKVEDYKLANVIFDPSRNLFGIMVRGVENKPRILYKLSEIISSTEANIISLSISDPLKEKVSVFLHIESGDEEKVLKRLTESRIVEEAELIKSPIKGFSHQPFFPVKCMLRGERALIMREGMYRALVKGLRMRLGDTTAQAILFYAGMEAGKEVAEDLRKLLAHAELEEILNAAAILSFSMGLARVNEVKVGGEEIRMTLSENWEASALGRGFEEPQCSFTRGYLKGLVEKFTGKEVEVKEEACEAAGASACIFSLKL